jgi:signal transduction histidine kinase
MPSPNAELLFRRLQSDSATERLEAARYFAQYAQLEHEQALREAVAREPVLWIKSALRRALARISPTPELDATSGSIDRDDLPAGLAEQLRAEALETTASQLMHEIEPLLGSLRLAAETEVNNFEESSTRRVLDRLDEFFSALSRLRRAASAPKSEEFSLDETIQRCIDEVQIPEGIQIQRAGPQPCIVEGDSSLVSMSFTNGLRNAVEATVSLGSSSARLAIAITWGTTDVDIWVSVVDVGIGFKGNLQRAFDIGSTSKRGHLGMGLAIANQAMNSMGGRVMLVPNERGVRFEMRWPKRTE